MKVTDLTIYAFLDPAGGKRGTIKSTRARSAIIVIGVDQLERIFVLHTWADRAATEKIIEKVFQINAQWRPKRFGCEANAQQSLFAGAISYAGKFKGQALTLYPINQPTKITKEFRIRTILQPIISEGRLFVQTNMHELRTELQSFPVGMTVDLVDALASACTLVPSRPTQRRADEEVDHLQQYLQDSGLSSEEIELSMEDLANGDAQIDTGPVDGNRRYYSRPSHAGIPI